MTTFASYSAMSIRDFQTGAGELKYREQINAPVPTANATFGFAMGMSTDAKYLVITEPYVWGGTSLSRNAQAHIYTQNANTYSYEYQTSLQPNNYNGTTIFGSSVDMNGSGNIVVGGDTWAQIGSNTFAGSATIFTRLGNTWSQLQQITANIPITNESFGYSTAISDSGNYIVVGSFSSNKNVYVFNKSGNTYVQQAKLNPSDIGTGGGNGFGYSVTINPNENFIAVGAIGDNNNRGAVYLYNRSGNTWTQINKITASANTNALVGRSVKIGDDGSGNALMLWMGSTEGAYYSIGPYWTTTYLGITNVGRAIDITQTYGGNVPGQYDRVVATGTDIAKTNVNWKTASGYYELEPGFSIAGTEYGHAVTMSDTGNSTVISGIYANIGNAYIGVTPRVGAAYVFTEL